jgi:FlaA1/EpsC-like NDP-sugar epimerase
LLVKNPVLIALDATLVAAAYSGAFLLLNTFSFQQAWTALVAITLPGVVGLRLIVLWRFHSYDVIWRHIGMVDLLNTAKACVLGSAILLLAFLVAGRASAAVVSVLIVDSLLTTISLVTARVLIRLRSSSEVKRQVSRAIPAVPNEKRRIVIVGAGEVGEKVLREIRDNGRLRYEPVGFLDDDPRKRGSKIHGLTVLGGVDRLDELSKTEDIEEAIIAIGRLPGVQMRRIVQICRRSGIPFRTVPVLEDILEGRIGLPSFRPVSYEDLLRRPVVHLDDQSVRVTIQGKSILVTGAGGSIGSELCRQICRFEPANLILCESSENNLFEIQNALSNEFPRTPITPFLSDVQNFGLMTSIFESHEPGVVIHAAAFKHVPLMETFPHEAIKNNVRGTMNMLTLSRDASSERFVLVSTDKAVHPVNVMGATKRVAELLTLEYARHSDAARFMIVRFGNVAGSRGSVIPLFRQQIERGGPVTVTHPQATRYFMTIGEAAQLILQAGAMGTGGEVFILEMGEPIKIVDLASDMIRLSGMEPDDDIEIRFIGLRPGEKLSEELYGDDDEVASTANAKIMVVKEGRKRLDSIIAMTEELLEAADNGDGTRVGAILKEIVPDYGSINAYGTGAGPQP